MALPNITIAPGINAIEGGLPGEFIITLDAPAPVGGLIVKFAVSGSSTATATTDYTFGAGNNITSLTANTFTVAAGASTAIIRVTAPIDGVFDPNETITLNLTDSVKYSPVSNFNAGIQPRSVTSADINRDGKLDLVVANQTGGVSILYRNGSGGFSAPNFVGTGLAGASAVEVFDFNGDGIFDIVATDSDRDNPLTSNIGKVSVLLGTGNGGFSAPQILSSGPWLKSVAVGDFNGDGKSDLVVASFDNNAISIFNGGDNGVFSNGTPFAVGIRPLSIAVGSFNGNSKFDLAVVNLESSNISIILDGGANTIVLPAGLHPTSIAIDDFDGDNKTDLAVTSWENNNVSILFGNGDGNFSRTKTVGLGEGIGSYSVKTGDFNGDGKADLAVAKFNSNEISVVLGNGNGEFDAPTIFSLGTPRSTGSFNLVELLKRFTPLTVGDFNGDGRSDLAVANFDNNNVSVLLNVSPRATLSITNILPSPINIVPTAQTVNEDTQIAITGISVNDLDGNLASTKLTVANGTLNVDITGGSTIITGANSSSTLTLAGTQAQINAALGTLKYQGNRAHPKDVGG